MDSLLEKTTNVLTYFSANALNNRYLVHLDCSDSKNQYKIERKQGCCCFLRIASAVMALILLPFTLLGHLFSCLSSSKKLLIKEIAKEKETPIPLTNIPTPPSVNSSPRSVSPKASGHEEGIQTPPIQTEEEQEDNSEQLLQSPESPLSPVKTNSDTSPKPPTGTGGEKADQKQASTQDLENDLPPLVYGDCILYDNNSEQKVNAYRAELSQSNKTLHDFLFVENSTLTEKNYRTVLKEVLKREVFQRQIDNDHSFILNRLVIHKNNLALKGLTVLFRNKEATKIYFIKKKFTKTLKSFFPKTDRNSLKNIKLLSDLLKEVIIYTKVYRPNMLSYPKTS